MSRQQENLYPPVAFHFRLQILGSEDPLDYGFQEISGIKTTLDTEAIAEGGENRFQHQLPIKTTYSPLVLKRGMALYKSVLTTWCDDTMEFSIDKPIKTYDLLVSLLDEEREPVLSWKFINAYPTSWEASNLNAEESSIFFETINLNYNYYVLV
ncbi:phage tail protein [Flavivirga jejuensis]|uniref:Phage tail protein n=1 Tax=Flavivirga jejuensis TaxID=870487 RepID=A0ABT8WP26_9FLAO|nr:phage tail protein [Flavivirga jejuensis]MDO5974917.1 phage tail protein [Flavivirga jejuensis]